MSILEKTNDLAKMTKCSVSRPNGAARYLRGMAISSPSAGRPGGVGGSPKKFPEKFSENGVRDKHHRVSDVSVNIFLYIFVA